jgi:NTP pyrophosphatase (non-canonical NTP hydrolase)
MALAAEVGELLELFQWEPEDKQYNDTQKIYIAAELADILIYLVRLADVLDITLISAVENKIYENERRYPADMVRGSAKKYDE